MNRRVPEALDDLPLFPPLVLCKPVVPAALVLQVKLEPAFAGDMLERAGFDAGNEFELSCFPGAESHQDALAGSGHGKAPRRPVDERRD